MSERVLGNHPDAGPGLSTSSDGGSAAPPHRRVTSFVRQRNRLTEGQAHAWDRLWAMYGFDVADIVAGPVAYDPPAWFGRRVPLVLEIGSGTGESTAAQAAAAPEADHLAVEVFEPGLAQLLMRIDEAGLTNLRLLRGDAVDLLRERVPRDSLAGDPDLLPRPVAQAAAPQAPARAAGVRRARRLPPRPGWASCTWPPTGRTTRSRCGRPAAASHCWRTPRPPPTAGPRARNERPETKFERRARMEGRDVRDLVFRRISAPQSFTH